MYRTLSSITLFLSITAMGCIDFNQVNLEVSPVWGSYQDPIDITFSSTDTNELYFSVSTHGMAQNLDSQCLTFHDGVTPIEIKDNSLVNFYALAQEDSGLNDASLAHKFYEIKTPVYPNSLMREAFLAAEAKMLNTIICENSENVKTEVGADGEVLCTIDIDVSPKDGEVSDSEISDFIYTVHAWSSDCPEGGGAGYVWSYNCWNSDINWPMISISASYNDCGIDGIVIDGELDRSGNGSIGNLKQSLFEFIMETETNVTISGAYHGRFREISQRFLDIDLLVESSRLGVHYASCNDIDCAPYSTEVTYQFSDDYYVMYDPTVMVCEPTTFSYLSL